FSAYTSSASTAIYPLSLHDALPILHICDAVFADSQATGQFAERIMGGKANISVLSYLLDAPPAVLPPRQFKSAKRFLFVGRLNTSEEHTSELQSRENIVCRLLLDKK